MKRLILLPICTFIFLITASVSARAEYYMVVQEQPSFSGYTYVGSGCGSCCRHTCCRTTCCHRSCGGYYTGHYTSDVVYYPAPVVYMNYVSPHRYNYQGGSEEVAEYRWVPYP